MVFWEHGYDGASLSRLQAATGVSASALYRAFSSKEHLFKLSVRRYQERHGFSIRADIPFAAAVREYLERAAREFTTDPGRGCLISTGLLATGPDATVATVATAVVRAEREHAPAMLRKRVRLGVEHAELPGETDIEGLARTLAALIQGMSVQARDGASHDALIALAGTAEHALPPCP